MEGTRIGDCAMKHTVLAELGLILIATTTAHAYTVGYTNFNLGGDGTRVLVNTTGVGNWVNGGNGAANSNGKDDGELRAGDQGTGETSWYVDWHATTRPTRSVKRIMLYPGSRTPGHFRVWKGVWNGSLMVWSNAFETNVAGVAQNFRPIFVDVDIRDANGVKYEVIAIGELSYVTGCTNRGMADIMLFDAQGTRYVVDLVSPNSAIQSTQPPYTTCMSQATLNLTINGTREDVQGYFNTNEQRYVWITYSFDTPQYLSGVFININPIHDPKFCWKTWDIRDLSGNVLVSSELGPEGDNTIATSCDRMQFLQFPDGPRFMSGFVMQGKFGQPSPPGDPTHGNRMGELWGVLAEPPRGTLILIF